MKDLDTKTKDNDSILDDAVSNTIKKYLKQKIKGEIKNLEKETWLKSKWNVLLQNEILVSKNNR